MKRLSLLLVLAFTGLCQAAPVPKENSSDYVSLKDKINVKLDETLHSDRFPENTLAKAGLKAGVQKLGDVKFDIGAGILQLGSSMVKDKPEKFEGIKVGRTAAKLHFLQAAGFYGEKDSEVGKYVIHYADKTKVEVKLLYGKHLIDWWAYPDREAPTDAKAVWEGENEPAKEFKAKIKLYHMEWKNPHPDKEIASIDLVAIENEGGVAPFCVAITCEGAKTEEKKEK